MAEVILQRVARMGMAVAGGTAAAQYCLFSVDVGHQAVMFDKFRGGVVHEQYKEGTHPRIPFFQEPHIIDIRAQPREIKTITGTKDLQQVSIYLRVLSRPMPEKLSNIYQDLGLNFGDRLLPSLCNEPLKAIVAKYSAEELLSKRAEISAQLKNEINRRAGEFNILLDDVSITHLVYGKEFTSAVEAKQVAQQTAERQEWVVKKAEQEKKAAIIRAQGEAEAAEIVTSALKECGSGVIEVRRIDMAKEIAGTLARSRNITYLPSSAGGGSNLLLGLNAGQS
mmetsp:Transcript_28945/g.59319  ORF Transcript_28945/g.59319 Transcript_28945/m.59319 type:complete len:281 (-) Transcript_28945:319-1161(-)